jgi:DNA-binding transcriptional regulator YdaS (Cro superfamily)
MPRSIAQQTVEELGGPGSVFARQRRDHEELDGLMRSVRATTGAEQEEVLNRMCRLVFSHAFAEEAVLWPELRRLLPDGEALTLRVEQEHEEVNQLWTRLEAHPLPAERAAIIARLVAVLREDVRDEEDKLLPRLQEVVDVRRLRRLGVAWELVRRTAPTRPHPVVSRRPPGNALAALPLSVLDRGRDVLDVAARRGPARLRPSLRSGSRVLARGAGRVEHGHALRRGEHPSTHRP